MLFCLFVLHFIIRSEKSNKRIFTTPPMRCGLKTQDMPLSQRHFHLYVVLIRFPVTARTPQGRTLCLFPHRGTLPESCYTPESRICRKRLSGNLKELLYVCLLSLLWCYKFGITSGVIITSVSDVRKFLSGVGKILNMWWENSECIRDGNSAW